MMTPERLNEIKALIAGNGYWSVSDGERLNMLDECLEEIECLQLCSTPPKRGGVA